MKRILKTLGRLYPRAWRERYGEEFDAILEDRKPCLLDIADVLLGAFRMRVSVRHLVQIVLPCGLAGAAIAWGIAARTPARYSSDAVVNFTSDRLTAVCSNPDELPATLRPSKGACGESRAVMDKGMQAWIQPALDRDFLISAIKSKRLYWEQQQSHVPIEQLVDTMRAHINLRPIGSAENGASTQAYRIEFQYSEPHLAHDVVAMLASHAIEASIQSAVAQRKAEGSSAPRQYARTGAISRAPSLPTRPVGFSRVHQVEIGFLVGTLAGLLLTLPLGPKSAGESGKLGPQS